jgi:hypothetical protein
VADNWYRGNAHDEVGTNRGWLLGYFVNPDDSVRSTTAVEVKWGVHHAGQQRPEWTVDEQRTTLIILVSGRFRVDLSIATVLLERQGDYAVWGPGINHSWGAESDSVVVTVRWPSLST